MKYSLIIVALGLFSSAALASNQNLECKGNEKLILLCRSKLPYDRQDLRSLIRSVILCQAGNEVYFNHTLESDDHVAEPQLAEVSDNPGGDFPIPTEFVKIYIIEGGALGVTPNRKKAMMTVGFARQFYSAEMNCQ